MSNPAASRSVTPDYVYRYPIDVRMRPAPEHGRVTEVVRLHLAEILDLVTLYDREGRELSPCTFAFMKGGKPVSIWPGSVPSGE